jgi:ACS family glucarate transporter-like MFS transporter
MTTMAMSAASPAATATRTHFRWSVAGLIFVIYTIAAADRANIGFALPFIRKEFAMSNTEAGALLSLFLWGYAIAQIPSGLAVEKFGVSRLFSWAMLLTSGLTALTGLSSSPLMLQLSRFGLGLAEAPLPIGIGTTINNWFSPKEKGTASGIFLSAVKFGPVIVPPIAAVIVSIWGWREIFYVFAVPGILLAVVWYVLVPDHPSESRFCSQQELDAIADRSVIGEANTARRYRDFGLLDRLILARRIDAPLTTKAQVFRSWDIWGAALGYAFQLGISNYLLAWIPTYLITVKKFTVAGTGLVAAAPWVGAVVGNLVGGFLSDRWLDKRRKPGMMFSALATAGTMYALIQSPADPVAFAALLFATGMLLSIGFSAYMAYAMGLASKRTYPVANSIVNMGGQIGGACAPLIAGMMLDRYGWDSVFTVMACGSAMTFLVLLTIKEPLAEWSEE